MQSLARMAAISLRVLLVGFWARWVSLLDRFGSFEAQLQDEFNM